MKLTLTDDKGNLCQSVELHEKVDIAEILRNWEMYPCVHCSVYFHCQSLSYNPSTGEYVACSECEKTIPQNMKPGQPTRQSGASGARRDLGLSQELGGE